MALTSLQAKALAAKKQSMYDTQEMTTGAANARRRKLLSTVDPGGTLTEAERNRRADALLRAQMLDLVVRREMKRKATKAQRADAAILAIVQPAKGCSLCRPLVNETHETCAAHQADMQRRMSR